MGALLARSSLSGWLVIANRSNQKTNVNLCLSGLRSAIAFKPIQAHGGTEMTALIKNMTAAVAALSMTVTPALAQPADNALSVRRTSDATGAGVWGDAPLLSEAFEDGADAGPANFKIVGIEATDTANRPGRVDERARILHDGAELKFETAAFSPAPPKLKPGWMLSHFIDVGQGNATLLEFSCGLALIDTGGQVTDQFDGPKRLAGYLEGVFKRRPELNRTIKSVFLTHPHADHTSGVTALLAMSPSLKIGSIVANARTNGSGWNQQKKLITFGKDKSIPVSLVTNESIQRSDGLTDAKIDTIACTDGDPDVRVLWGSDSGSHGWASEANNHSVVIRVDFGESSFLFTGDLEESGQPEFIGSYVRNPDIIDADIYQVSHHGSRNGTTEALLRVMTPEIAVIGAGNPADEEPGFSAYNFGHPNRIAINLLSDASFGVSKGRPEVTVPVGISGRSPSTNKPPRYAIQAISKAIFSTGWDGDIVIAASVQGEKKVLVE